MPEVSPEDFDSMCPPELRSLVKCVFCKNDLTEEAVQITGAKLTVCFHSVCQQCAEGWNDLDTKFCPECDVLVRKDLVEHKLLQELVEKPHSDATQKGMCGSGLHPARPANSWCNECESLVCNECVKAHLMLQNTTKHKIVDASSILPRSLVQFNCELHPTKRLEIFCGKCEVMTCRDCQLEHHKQHNDYEFIDVLCKEYKKELIKTQERLCQTQKTLEDSQKAAHSIQNDLRAKKKVLRSEIEDLRKKIVKFLDESFKNLLNCVDATIDGDIKEIANKMATTSQKMAPLNHCIQIMDLMLLHASDNTVFFSKKHMEKCLQVLLQGKIELANPDVKKRYTFNPGENIKLLLEQIRKVTDVGKITATTRNEGDTEMYRPFLKQFKLIGGGNDGMKADKPPAPARIQLRQDLQSPESHKSVERLSSDSRASASPEAGGMVNWHTPQEPRKTTSPAKTVSNNQSAQLLKDMLASNKQFAPATSYTPHTQVQPSLQRSMSQGTPSPAMQYVTSEVPQQQMQSVDIQPIQQNAPPSYYGNHQTATTRGYPSQTAAGSHRQNQQLRNASHFQNLLRSNDVSVSPTSAFQAQQSAQMQQQTVQHQAVNLQNVQQQPVQAQLQAVQQQSMQMQNVLRQSVQGQTMQMQPVPQPTQLQPMQVHYQRIQRMSEISGYIPGSTHNPYPEL